MNFKDFKKIDTTATHTIFKHKDGHLLHIANDKLPKELKKEMKDIPTQSVMERLREEKKVKKMAEGGSVFNPLATLKEAYSKKLEKKMGSPEVKSFQSLLGLDKEPVGSNVSDYTSLQDITPKDQGMMIKRSVPMMADGGEIEEDDPLQSLKEEMEAGTPYEVPYSVAPEPKRPEPGVDILESPEALTPGLKQQPTVVKEAKPMLENVQLPGTATPQQAAQAPAMPMAGELMGLEGAMQQIAGAEQVAAGQRESAAAQMEALQSAMDKRQEALDAIKSKRAEVESHINSLRVELETEKLDPSRVLGSGSERVFKTIGLILGGLAERATIGLLPLNLIKREIDDDIAKQKSEMETRNTLLGYNLKLLGNLEEAENLTRLQMADTIDFSMKKAALKSAGKEAQGRAQMFSGQIQQQLIAPIISQMEQRSAAQSMASQPIESPTQILQAINARVAPGSRRTAIKEYGEYQGITSRMNQVQKVMRQQAQINTLANRVFSPIQTSRLMENQKTQLFDIVKGIVGEKMTDQDVKSLVDPLVLKLYDSPQTADALTQQLLGTLQAKAKERLPTLTLHGIDLPFPVKATPIPTRKK